MIDQTNGYYVVPKRTLLQRMLRRLFPARPLMPVDESTTTDWAIDEMLTTVDIRLDWVDRLRVLVSGRVAVDVRTQTERTPGRVWSRSSMWVRAPGRAGD